MSRGFVRNAVLRALSIGHLRFNPRGSGFASVSIVKRGVGVGFCQRSSVRSPTRRCLYRFGRSVDRSVGHHQDVVDAVQLKPCIGAATEIGHEHGGALGSSSRRSKEVFTPMAIEDDRKNVRSLDERRLSNRTSIAMRGARLPSTTHLQRAVIPSHKSVRSCSSHAVVIVVVVASAPSNVTSSNRGQPSEDHVFAMDV